MRLVPEGAPPPESGRAAQLEARKVLERAFLQAMQADAPTVALSTPGAPPMRVLAALGALAPAAIRQLDEELAGDFKKSIESQAAKLAAKASAWESIEAPAVTVAIRTNGVEHRQASSYVQRLVMGVLGLELSEEKETVRRYVVTHLDEEKQVLFHPVLLEKMHTSK